MYDKLKDIFLNVNEWLKFAEAKHAALIALNVATIFGLTSTYGSLKDFKGIGVAFSISLLLLVGSVVYSLLKNFFPRTKMRSQNRESLRVINLFFWGHTQSLTRPEFLQELDVQETNCSRLELNLIDQILQNSQIAASKYESFKIALVLTTCNYITLFLYLIYHVLD